MIPLDETYDGTFPFAPHTFDGHGFAQHYVDEGPRDGEAIVCLHGEPTWGYLYRKMIGPLSQHYRVIVPDHMGFGKSETPQDRPYTLQQHTENLAALVEHLGVDDITLMGQDWGGPIMTQYAVRHPARVKRMIYANTIAGYGQVGPEVPEISASPWFRWIGAGLDNGRTEQVLRNAGSTVLSVMKIIGFQNSAAVDDTWIRAYSDQFPDWESAIGAYEFPIDAYLGRIRDYIIDGLPGVPELVIKPAILMEGLEDRAIPPERAIADFRALWPSAPVIELPGVGHFCQEDAPDILVTNIHQFMQTNP
ncbi:MAG: alpha/beta fold hydrolase [Actinomycetia bacterium]|nr:alpha/beta fold hydrolase [Actinomycetes bacterium]MCP4962397.1 alpha/beta fold hydrolase [Actinomycetes bacterium]